MGLLNAVSLFSGIGGLDHGLHQAGFRHLLLCESDPWRRSVLRARFPGVPVADDVRGVGVGHLQPDGRSSESTAARYERDVRGRVACDLLCGGFPCQDLSVAGRRAGLAGERSGLFFEFARVAESFRPRWILVENVPGLLSSNGGRDFGVVLGTLADLGYGLAWRVLNSRFFGVPQRRRRVFIVGALADENPRAAAERAGQVLAVGSRCAGHPATRGEAREDLAGTLGGGAGERGWAQDTERMTFVPTTAFHQTQDPITEENASPALGRTSIGMGVNEGASVRRLTPVECERLQALPDGWTDPHGDAPDSRRYDGLGDAVPASVAEWIGRRIISLNA